jgi:L-rhamnose mutarotase
MCFHGQRRSHGMTKRFCLTLDLNDDPKLIAEYKRYHEKIWPEITKSIKEAGVLDLEIYLRGTRMFMILEVDESFSFEKKAAADRTNPKVQEWEKLMWKFQKALPDAHLGEKWLPMERIFVLEK